MLFLRVFLRLRQDRTASTADQQKANKSLSTYAHNIKVISQNGKVTLRGPVHSQDEKANVESKAAAAAGKENVSSYIDVVAK